MLRVLTVALVALDSASGLVAHAPALRPVSAASSARVGVSPQMGLGGAGRSVMRAIRVSTPKLPGFNKGISGNGGMGRGADGGDGGATSGGEMAASDDDDSVNPLVQAWKTYEELLDSKPLLMKALTSFVGFALGDILAQKFIQKTDPFDYLRLLRLCSFGFLVHGTTSHYFYGWLDGKIPGTTARVVFTKVFIDQVLWNPCFGVMFFSYVALLEAKGIQYVIDKTKNELLTQVTGSWKVWPLAHTINFKYIPSNQRVLYINTIQIGYNCFLSLISNRDSE